MLFLFFSVTMKYIIHKRICTRDEEGVASPILNRVTPAILLISHETGILTQKAPTIPCVITKNVFPHPLK